MTPGERLRESTKRTIDKFGNSGFLIVPTTEPIYDSTSGDYNDSPARTPIKYIESPSEQNSVDAGLAKFKYSELTLYVDESIGDLNETCKLEGYDGSIYEFISLKTVVINNVTVIWEVEARTSL